MNNKIVLMVACILFLLFSHDDSFSWDATPTHQALSRSAATHSVLDKTNGDYLKHLGFEKGLEERFLWNGDERRADQWLAIGALLEDAGSLLEQASGGGRFNNHFHNPLKPWAQAGLHDLQTGQSSLLWAQDAGAQAIFPEGDWSWQTLRTFYYQALTASTPEERSAAFAQTFRGLGHQMHLLQDAAQPDHARNDAHPADSTLHHKWHGSRYTEWWAKRNQVYINALAAQPLFPQVDLTVAPQGLAPIAQLMDTDRYNGTNPSAALTQGIAEYTNANFFSDDTLFAAETYAPTHKHYFPYPKRSSTDRQAYEDQQLLPETVVSEDAQQDVAFWIAKTGDGERIVHFVRPSYWAREILQASGSEGAGVVKTVYERQFYLDEACLADYAHKLIPRAVGYSAALVNYFFRGRLTVEQATAGQNRFVIVNQTDEAMQGEFALYYESTEQGRAQAWSATLTLSVNGRSLAFEFKAPEDTQYPGEYVLAFRGKLGAEERAVVGARVRLFTTVQGTLRDRAGRRIADVPVIAVAGEEPHLYESTPVASDANGDFVIDNVPADRGDIYIKVWSKCAPCNEPRAGLGSMIPPQQLIPWATWGFTGQFDWFVDHGFPVMRYRAKTAPQPPAVDGMVDFGTVPVAYVSIVYDPVTVDASGGAATIFGSFSGEIVLYTPEFTWLSDATVGGFGGFVSHAGVSMLRVPTPPYTQGNYYAQSWYIPLSSGFWALEPTVSQGRVVLAFDDADGQAIGTLTMAVFRLTLFPDMYLQFLQTSRLYELVFQESTARVKVYE